MANRLTLLLLTIVCLYHSAEASDKSSAESIISVFRQYESLNNRFVASTGSVSEAKYRREAEEYAADPYLQALNLAVHQVCVDENTDVLHALFQVIFSTSNSASEMPAWSLGNSFVCQPDLFEKEFRTLSENKQKALYPLLGFGFENVVYRQRGGDAEKLRSQLAGFAPGKK